MNCIPVVGLGVGSVVDLVVDGNGVNSCIDLCVWAAVGPYNGKDVKQSS